MNNLPQNSQHVLDALRIPDPGLSVTEWCSRNIYLSPRESSKPGKYNPEFTPYVSQILNDIGDPRIQRITLVGSTQSGKTRTLLNSIAYLISERPAPILWVSPTENEALKFSRNRFSLLLEDNSCLARLTTESPRDIKTLEYKLKTCTTYFAWANSPATLASFPIAYAVLDEVDKYPSRIKNEADPVSLAIERTRTYWYRKIILTSTPTVPDSPIDKSWQSSDQRKYYVPCPSCGVYQSLDFAHIKWPEGERSPDKIHNLKLAWYECPYCQHRITDRDKPSMLSLGEWRRLNPEAENPVHVGYHINCLYSPWLTFSEIASEFLLSKDDPIRLQNFRNSWLAEPWQDVQSAPIEISAIKSKAIANTRKRGELPRDTRIVAGGVDWHGELKGLYWSIWAFDGQQRRHLVDYGIARDPQQIVEIMSATPADPDGHRYNIYWAVDSGYETETVYSLTRDHYPKAMPSKGYPQLDAVPWRESRVEYKGKTQVIRGFNRLDINTGYYKDALFVRLANLDGGWYIDLPAGTQDNFFSSLSSEHKVLTRNGKAEWVKRYSGAPNHWLDTLVIAWAVADKLGLSRLKSSSAPAVQSPPVTRDRAEPQASLRRTTGGNKWASMRRH